MGEKEIRDEIAAVLGAVEGIGRVHTYQRWAATWDGFLDLFRYEDADGQMRIGGAVVTRIQEATHEHSFGKQEVAHVFAIRFYFGHNDEQASEVTFQALLGTAKTAINADDDLNASCTTTGPEWGPMSGFAGLQVNEIDLRVFGGVLCHFADCRLCAVELVDI